MSYLAYISIGLYAALVIQSARKMNYPLAALWACYLLVALAFSSNFSSWVPIILLALPRALSAYIYFFFQRKKQIKRELFNLAPILLILGLWSYGVAWINYLIFGYLLWETIVIGRALLKFYRLRGISFFSRAGNRILGINLQLISTFLILFSFFFAFEVGIIWLVVLALASTWHFSANNSYDVFHTEKYLKSDLQAEAKASILAKLDQLIAENDYLLRGDASLTGLAKKLNTSTHHLSQIINESRQQTFFGLLASVRIKAAKSLLTDPKYQHQKIEEIANIVGYASKSAFNTAFKKITGLTPSQYRERGVRSDKVERSPEQIIPHLQEVTDTFDLSIITSVMLLNFIKVYYRNLRRNRVFAAINIAGLTITLGSCLLIYVYLSHEISYDRFHENAEDIYRVTWMTGNPQTRTPHPLAQAMVSDFSDVEAGVSLTPIYGPGLTLQSIYIRNVENNRVFKEPDAFMADSTFFDVFDFKLTNGNVENVLRNVGDIVVTESIAQKYFDNEDPLGKHLEIVEYGFTGIIVGVMQDAPSNSHFHPKIIVSYVTRKSVDPDSFWWTWADFGHFNYVKLKPGTNPRALEAAIPDWLLNYIELTPDQLLDMKSRRNYAALQPITDIHLKSNLRWELESNSNMAFIRILWAAIAFLIIIASVNFINLSSARALERIKEFGIRRTLGGGKFSILLQYVSETVLTTLVALFLGYLIAFSSFTHFQQLTGKDITTTALLSADVLFLSLMVALFIGILGGLYPAISIMPIKPVDTLKGKFVNQNKGSALRRGLIALQFIVSTIMIFGSAIVLFQVKYMEETELGFTQDHTIVFELHSQEQVEKIELIKNELLKINGVIGVGGISNLPGGQFNQNGIFASTDPENRVDVSELRVDHDALQILGIELSDGRWFDESMAQDSLGSTFIVNQIALDQLNLEDQAFETPIVWDEEDGPREGKIVGIVENFHYKSLHVGIQPIVINVMPNYLNYILVKVEAGANTQSVISQMEQVHAKFDKQLAFDYSFLDQLLADQYESERKALSLFNLFTALALVLSGMGLLGLAYLVISQRTREIGIRKVVGAHISDILVMENLSFLKVIAVALIIGLPVAYFIMQLWLQGFAYRISFEISPFVITVVSLVVIAVLTVTLAVLRTVLINPSRALRYE